MYARQPRRQQFVYPQSKGHFYRPSASAYSYAPYPYHEYQDALYVEEPSSLESLEWEEQQLLKQQAAILEERQRIAAEKRRLQLAEQEHLRQWQLEQAYLERYRQQALQQQAIQKQQQIRQRQLAAQKEAQLEAVLRELEYASPLAHKSVMGAHCAHQQASCAAQKKNVPQATPTVSSHPFEWFIQAILPNESRGSEPSRRQAQAKPQAAQAKTAAAPTSSSRVASSPSTHGSTPVQEPSKRFAAVSAIQALKKRVEAANQRVSDLLATQFDRLTLRQFGNVDNELMQILLALDNVSTDTESNRSERKQLVKEMISLLGRVDEYKDQFSRSSSETSSSNASESDASESDAPDTNSDAGSEHMEVDNQEELVDDIDADSNASDVEETAPFATSSSTNDATLLHAPHESSQVPISINNPAQNNHFNSDAMEVSLPNSQNDLANNDEEALEDVDNEVIWDEEDDGNDGDNEHEKHDAPLASNDDQIASSSNNQASNESQSMLVDAPNSNDEASSPALLDDPFGFNIIHETSKKFSNDHSSSSVPIQIGNARKSSVVIESVPSAH